MPNGSCSEGLIEEDLSRTFPSLTSMPGRKCTGRPECRTLARHSMVLRCPGTATTVQLLGLPTFQHISCSSDSVNQTPLYSYRSYSSHVKFTTGSEWAVVGVLTELLAGRHTKSQYRSGNICYIFDLDIHQYDKQERSAI
jgi:hypothetical protein